MKGFLDYAYGATPLHRMNPLVKLIMALLLCAACFITHSHFVIIGLIALNLGGAKLGGILPRTLGILKKLVKFTGVLFVIQIFFVPQGQVLIPLPFGLAITTTGLSFSLLICLRLIGATLPLCIMLSLTQMSELTHVLVCKLRMPYKYAFALTTAIRFIPVLASDMAGIVEAQTARGVELDCGVVKRIRLILPLCVPLLVSSVQRIEGSAISAELRGFNLRTRDTSSRKYGFTKADLMAVCGGIAAVVLCIAV